MITEFLLNVFFAVADWCVGLFPEWDVPAEITGFDGMVNDLLAAGSALGAWVPWALVIICVGIALGAWVIGYGLKFIAWLYGQVPVFGGSG